MSVLGWINAGIDLVKSGFGIWESLDNRNYSREQQQVQYDREDNAVQRRKEDLVAAGLSPVLAAGSAAGVGSVVDGRSNMWDKLSKLDAINAFVNTKTNIALQQQAQTNADILRENLQYEKKAHEYDLQVKMAKAGTDMLDLNYYLDNDVAPHLAKLGTKERVYDAVYNLATQYAKSKYGVDIKDAGSIVSSGIIDKAVDSVVSPWEDAWKKYENKGVKVTRVTTSGGTHSGRSGTF